ncbi:MAG: rRNA maturation RNase YbeY, partial [Bauldia sp.]|nr:rRNA maturation RNase YbeY [Bauldia sp.]
AREAAEQHLTFDHHLTHLIVHGLLHLFGHDHIDEGEAEVMESLETAILRGLGIEDPYAARDFGVADG